MSYMPPGGSQLQQELTMVPKYGCNIKQETQSSVGYGGYLDLTSPSAVIISFITCYTIFRWLILFIPLAWYDKINKFYCIFVNVIINLIDNSYFFEC